MKKDDTRQLRMAIIAGASHALKFKDQNPRAQSDEIIQHVTENVREILDNIDDPL